MRISRAAGILAAAAMVLLGNVVIAAGSATASTKPLRGGVVTIGSPPLTLDPASPSVGLAINSFFPIYGALFLPTSKGFTPDLATGYTYSHGDKELTIALRHGVKFQDGTPFNAQAVVFNMSRYEASTSTASADFTTVTSVTAQGRYAVVFRMSSPDANLIGVFSETVAAFIASPQAVTSEGQNFGLNPVGAGPFKLVSFNPQVSVQTQAWSGYWDAKHRYLSGINFLAISPAVNVDVADVQSGSLSFIGTNGAVTPPTLLQQAKTDPSLTVIAGPDTNYEYVSLNETRAPFNNQSAREALDYCMDRGSIASGLTAGYARAAYVLSGHSELYFPGVKAAQNLLPYQYNVSKGSAIVKQLGGLSFTLTGPNSGQQEVLFEALGAQWSQCGINVSFNFQTQAQVSQAKDTGQFQALIQAGGGAEDPILAVDPVSVPTAVQDKFGISSPTLTNLLNATNYTTNPTALAGIWQRIYSIEDTHVENIPVLSAPVYGIESHCLRGTSVFQASGIYNNAYFICRS